MTQPPLPAPTVTVHPCRPTRNLTPNRQRVSGVVPLPALSVHQKEAERSRTCSHPGYWVKNVRNSFCILVCTTIFTLARPICREDKQIENSTPQSTGGKTPKTGGRAPTLSASSRPKSSWGRSRPFSFRSRLYEPHRRTSGEPVRTYAVHPGVHLRVHSVSGCIV